MKIDSIDVEAAITHARQLIEDEADLSPALRSSLEILLLLVTLLMHRLGLNSSNSSRPPSSDPDRKRKARAGSKKPGGGQKGHIGTTLVKVDDPDDVISIKIDRRTLPTGSYTADGFETRQVFDIDISRIVTEYRAQRLIDEQGRRFVAPFPEGVTKAVQYGDQLKAHAVYLSQYQLLPCQRIKDYFSDQLQIPISEGSLVNFNQPAFEKLASFEPICKQRLAAASVVHADETGININGARYWLHCASNDLWTHYFPHVKRGKEAMDVIGILPDFHGILCHDHWKPYYKSPFTHALCNAHHLRELTRAREQDGQQWAKEMETLLKKINQVVDDAGGKPEARKAACYRRRYRDLLEKAQIECPPPTPLPGKPKRGRLKRSKSRNLLERLINYPDDVLRFMREIDVPFTNNLGENDIRMTRVQQKISGCFRSEQGAITFCRIRGYLSTCRKHHVSASEALVLVFKGKLPEFTQ